MPAGVHLALGAGAEVDVDLLGHRERVHVAAQQHDRALAVGRRRATAAQHAGDRGGARARADLEVEALRAPRAPSPAWSAAPGRSPGCGAGRAAGPRGPRRRRWCRRGTGGGSGVGGHGTSLPPITSRPTAGTSRRVPSEHGPPVAGRLHPPGTVDTGARLHPSICDDLDPGSVRTGSAGTRQQHRPRGTVMSTSSTSDPKQLAKRLRTALADEGTEIGHGRALELVARMLGHRDWNTCPPSRPSRAGPAPGAIPLLRIFDTGKALEFYRDFLGFEVAWEHRFQDHAPLYAEVVRDGVRLHLTEHHGDASARCRGDRRDRRRAGLPARARREGLRLRASGRGAGGVGPGGDRHRPVPEPVDVPAAARGRARPGRPTTARRSSRRSTSRRTRSRPSRRSRAGLDRWWDRRLRPAGDAPARRSSRAGRRGRCSFTGAGTHGWDECAPGSPRNGSRSTSGWRRIPTHPTVLELSFEPDGAGTLVTLTHGGWTAGNVAERGKFTDWPVLLERYAAHVRTG